ncbi:threonine ammonia-lyase [Yunchengibacter salinarum]|uniref:threonine ammonia-lyase n=1 Tax=Yunchengibacter salinarum TaxID=3133399 RepID=UPI0035B5A51E
MSVPAITIDDIETAAHRLALVVVRTPLMEHPLLNERLGGRVLIKPENQQVVGSFKLRGAYNAIAALGPEQRARGVVAFSSGNHAQGVARAASLMGVPATIVMPSDAPAIKIENTRAFGATIAFYDRYSESREALAQRLADDTGAALIPSFDHPDVMAGQGTVGLEIAEELAARGIVPDQALICCGGGGLSSGSFLALHRAFPRMAAYTVEPSGFDDTARSLKSGARERVDPASRSVCDALLSERPGALTLDLLRRERAKGAVVSDDQALAAVAYAARVLKQVVEPGGAVALAALLSGVVPAKGRTSVIVLSGGNIAPAMLSRALEQAE